MEGEPMTSPESLIYDTIAAGEKIVVVALFCGAGGMSSGAVRVLRRIAGDVGKPIGAPVPTISTRDRFALVVPELFPLGIDILFRMLKLEELAAAMGFESYGFAGNKTETVKQIGNAVSVNLAESLCEQLLVGSSPTLESFDPPMEVPSDD
ncbi:DNA cytosine methyltransferase [Saliphagus sp. LR7]|uniref:DNA cytosine methyltransferase n=1 Tax=Saliphagus sp. LR7 TaxID=2282654 RepID=UPI000DF771A6|nr:DNA cytosine methyltransferase [Saliphagus sp. LR7]